MAMAGTQKGRPQKRDVAHMISTAMLVSLGPRGFSDAVLASASAIRPFSVVAVAMVAQVI